MAQKQILKHWAGYSIRKHMMRTHNTRQRKESGAARSDPRGDSRRSLRRGFFGTAAVELSVQDGTIQHIRRTMERVEK